MGQNFSVVNKSSGVNKSFGAQIFAVVILLCPLLSVRSSLAQIDLRITPTESEFTLASPVLCGSEQVSAYSKELARLIAADLSITGLYRVLGPKELPEPLGSCLEANGGSFPRDLPEKKINQFVTGQVRSVDGKAGILVLDLFLRDVASATDVLGKRYQVSPEEIPAAAHAFANEILGLLTGKPGGFGGQVVYSSDADGQGREIFAMVLGSTERRQLTKDNAQAASPSWSPDGRSVAYSVSSKAGQSDVHLVPSIGGKSTKITFLAGEETRPSFGSDGKQLLVTARVSGKQSITLFNLRGRLLEKLSESSADNFDATWSSDYQQVVFVSNRSGESLIYVMKADGSRVREIGKLAGKTCFRPAWSPVESRVVVACSSPESNSQLYLVDLGTGEFNQVTFQGDNLEPAWSPDGRMIVFSTRENKTSPADLAVFSLSNLKVTMVAKTPQDDREPSWSYKALELPES